MLPFSVIPTGAESVAAERRDRREAICPNPMSVRLTASLRSNLSIWGSAIQSKLSFFFAPPGFDLLFSLDCGSDVRVLLEVNQSIETVLAGKTRDRLVLVLVITPLDVISDPNVKRSSSART